MRIGVPAEIKNNEFRVAITPSGVHALTRRGHTVTIQVGAGEGASIPDADYTAVLTLTECAAAACAATLDISESSGAKP